MAGSEGVKEIFFQNVKGENEKRIPYSVCDFTFCPLHGTTGLGAIESCPLTDVPRQHGDAVSDTGRPVILPLQNSCAITVVRVHRTEKDLQAPLEDE